MTSQSIFGLRTLHNVLATNPDLSIDGWRDICDSPNCPYSPDRFPARRALLLAPDYVAMINTAREFIQRYGIYKRCNSYGLKHDIEKWGASVDMSPFVTNGCAIAAALLSGYTIVREKNTPNCRFTKS